MAAESSEHYGVPRNISVGHPCFGFVVTRAEGAILHFFYKMTFILKPYKKAYVSISTLVNAIKIRKPPKSSLCIQKTSTHPAIMIIQF